MGAVAVRSRAARRTYGRVRCLGRRGTRARAGASASGRLRCGLLLLAGRRIPTDGADARPDPAYVPRRRHVGAVLPRQRHQVGGRITRCRRGRRAERAARVTRFRALASRVPVDGGVGIWTFTATSTRQADLRPTARPVTREFGRTVAQLIGKGTGESLGPRRTRSTWSLKPVSSPSRALGPGRCPRLPCPPWSTPCS